MRRNDVDARLNTISGQVVDAAIKVHRALGPGLYEQASRRCLAHELRLRGLRAEEKVPLDLTYEGLVVERAYEIDILVEGMLPVETKAVDSLGKSHFAQLSTYLKLSGRPLGLLINFDAVPLKDGIRRVVRS